MARTTTQKRILLQGATGSIGRNTISVVRAHTDHFKLVGLSANSSVDDLVKLATELDVETLAIASIDKDGEGSALLDKLSRNGIYWGSDALARQAAEADYDLLVNAVLGSAGMEATDAALRRGKIVALANKETLVAAGPLMLKTAESSGARIIPIDSEHSAILQCLLGERIENVRRIWLTTSGGPFYENRFNDLSSITVEEALNHPTWKMGPKITVDSATLFNKGLEVIEVERLFGIPGDRIRVVVHRQSIVHSLVEFVDGSIKAQLSIPDMKLPILFALSYPDRVDSDLVQTTVDALSSLTFEQVNESEYPCLKCAYDALRKGGTAPAALSAADEMAVQAFLDQKIRFTDIPEILTDVLDHWTSEPLVNLTQVRAADRRARQMAMESVSKHVLSLAGTVCY